MRRLITSLFAFLSIHIPIYYLFTIILTDYSNKWRHGEAVLWKVRCDAVSRISVSAIFFTYRGSLWFGAAWCLYNESLFRKPWLSIWWYSQSASSCWLVYQSYPVMDRSSLHEHIQVGEEFFYSCLWSPIHPAHLESSRRFAFSE